MFILFMAIFFVSIITVIYMINNFNEGLSPRRSEGVSYSQYETYKRYEKIIKKNVDNSSYAEDKIKVINIDNLDISNAIKTQCQGYALYDFSSYNIYLKCGNYKTSGFMSKYLEKGQ